MDAKHLLNMCEYFQRCRQANRPLDTTIVLAEGRGRIWITYEQWDACRNGQQQKWLIEQAYNALVDRVRGRHEQ